MYQPISQGNCPKHYLQNLATDGTPRSVDLVLPLLCYINPLIRSPCRQVVARNILDTIRSVADDAEDFENVLNLISRLADDREPSVRSELMEQVCQVLDNRS